MPNCLLPKKRRKWQRPDISSWGDESVCNREEMEVSQNDYVVIMGWGGRQKAKLKHWGAERRGRNQSFLAAPVDMGSDLRQWPNAVESWKLLASSALDKLMRKFQRNIECLRHWSSFRQAKPDPTRCRADTPGTYCPPGWWLAGNSVDSVAQKNERKKLSRHTVPHWLSVWTQHSIQLGREPPYRE